MSDDGVIKLVPKNAQGDGEVKHLYVKFYDEDECIDFSYRDWGISTVNPHVLYLFDTADGASSGNPILPTHGINLDLIEYWMAESSGT